MFKNLNIRFHQANLETPSRFFEVKTPEGKPLSRHDIEAEVLILLLAGADTTGTSFSSTLTDILSSPADYSRMMMEIDVGFATGNLSQPIPTAAEVSEHCPFYVSCIKESLRLNPASPVLFPREVTADQPPLIIDDKVIPIGTEITCSPYITNRDKDIYGEDANMYRPERWLEDSGEKAKLFDKYNFTWGYGSRICLGKDLAMMELMKFPLMVCHSSSMYECHNTNLPVSSFMSSISNCVNQVKKHQVLLDVFVWVACSIGKTFGSIYRSARFEIYPG